MKEIHLGPILTENRRRLGITQEDLARFWEYPKQPFPNGRPGVHLDKDTTSIPR